MNRIFLAVAVIVLQMIFILFACSWHSSVQCNNLEDNIGSENAADSQELENEYRSDIWGLDDILQLFDIWGWQPSRNPTSLEEVARKANCTKETVCRQEDKVIEILLSLPKESENIVLYTEESKRQYTGIVWNHYFFEHAENTFVNGYDRMIFGHAYLFNNDNKWKEDKPAIYLSYFYQYAEQQLIILEIMEVNSDICNYVYLLECEKNTQKINMSQEQGIRLLNKAAKINPYEKAAPLPKLEGEELKQYVGLTFLDIIRTPANLCKYEDILTEDSKQMFNLFDEYYEKPEEIYDFVRVQLNTETAGEMVITSQFQPTLWGNILVSIDILFQYDSETGVLSIDSGTFLLEEKP